LGDFDSLSSDDEEDGNSKLLNVTCDMEFESMQVDDTSSFAPSRSKDNIFKNPNKKKFNSRLSTTEQEIEK